MSLIRFLAAFTVAVFAIATTAQGQNRGPLKAHPGMEITTAFASSYGPDAESRTTVVDVNNRGVALSYTSSRGVVSRRLVPENDAMQAQTFVMGYANNMPEIIPNTTAMGLSTRALEQLRSTGNPETGSLGTGCKAIHPSRTRLDAIGS